MAKSTTPIFYKYWKNLGYHYIDIGEDYIRISDSEFDINGSTVILLDGYGAFRAYHLDEEGREIAIEFSPELSIALYRTWIWLKLEWIR